jgi:hypothetical protein
VEWTWRRGTAGTVGSVQPIHLPAESLWVFPLPRWCETEGVTTSEEPGRPVPAPTRRRLPRLTTRLSIAILVVAYLSLALTFTLLTRAYEADDESAHTDYVEYIVQHHSIPRISVANGGESHQPPLYYLLEAGWQEILGIPAFVPHVALVKGPITPNHLVLSHEYSTAEHQAAVHLHELRLLSVIFGLGTVLLTYAGARIIGLRQALALVCGLFVALLPRELVVSTDLTNDALIIPLCALSLVLYLLAERARSQGRFGHRRLHLLAMGVALGAGAITKLSGLPVAGILIALAFVPSVRVRRPVLEVSVAEPVSPMESTRLIALEPRFLIDGVIAVAAFLAVSGWWFIGNKILYGQFLATRTSEGYLKTFLGGPHPVAWSTHMLQQVPQVFLQTSWYGQPNLSLPTWVNGILAASGLGCLLFGAHALVSRQPGMGSTVPRLSAVALLGCILGGFIAVVILIKTTAIGDARVAYVGISAFSIVLVLGGTRVVERVKPRLALVGIWAWPTVLLVLDAYVIVRFLVPLGGL